MRSVVIISGGMDSTTLLYDVVASGEQVFGLTFDYGQRHRREIECARATCEKLAVSHRVIDLGLLGDLVSSALTRESIPVPEGNYTDDTMRVTVVPNRNMVMLSLAGAYAIEMKAEKLYYGAHSGDHAIYPDCRPAFVAAMKEAFSRCDWHPLSLEVPYLHYTKTGILRRGLELGVDYSLTWTCYRGSPSSCGKCGSCAERLEAFREMGIQDPLEYE
jgi:7-cyano-7-deazaguanine synthase